MENEFNPDWVSHPSETIVDWIKENLSDDINGRFLNYYKHESFVETLFGDFSEENRDKYEQLVSGKMVITEDLAEKLELAGCGHKKFWLRRQELFSESISRKLERIEEDLKRFRIPNKQLNEVMGLIFSNIKVVF